MPFRLGSQLLEEFQLPPLPLSPIWHNNIIINPPPLPSNTLLPLSPNSVRSLHPVQSPCTLPLHPSLLTSWVGLIPSPVSMPLCCYHINKVVWALPSPPTPRAGTPPPPPASGRECVAVPTSNPFGPLASLAAVDTDQTTPTPSPDVQQTRASPDLNESGKGKPSTKGHDVTDRRLAPREQLFRSSLDDPRSVTVC